MKKWDYRTPDNGNEINDEDMLMPIWGDDGGQVDSGFTERVMEQIRMTEIIPHSDSDSDSVAAKADYSVSHEYRRRPIRHLVMWTGSAAAAVAVAVLLFLAPGLSDPQRAATSSSQRLLILPSEWEDHHLAEARKAGVVKLPDIEVTDQGYTLTLQEVVADPNRMILNLRITDAGGQPDEEMMSMFDISQLQLLNEEGEAIGDLQAINHMDTKLADDKFRQEYLLLTYYFKDEAPGDTVLVKGNIHELVKDYKTNERITGDWSFSYAADMTTAKALTVATDLNKYSYTTPQGLRLQMNAITHSPAGVKFEFSTTLTDVLAARVPEDRRVNLGVKYHFEDANGKLAGGPVNSKYSGFPMIRGSQDLQLDWTYYMDKLDYLNEPVYFVLDGFSIPVESNDSVTFNPAELEAKPAEFSAQGDLLHVNNIKITETQAMPGLSAWMAVSGEFSNALDMDKWMARDGEGTEYDVIRWGSYRDADPVNFGQTDENTDLAYLIVDGMTAVPDELTLIRTVTDTNFTDVSWRFRLPGPAATSE